MQSAKGKTVVITGASTGIGRVASLLLAQQGYRVFAGVRRQEDADSLIAESNGTVTPLMLDVTQADQIAAAVRTVEKSLAPDDGVHALINNAGVIELCPLEVLPFERLRMLFDVNTLASVSVSQQFLPLIRRAKGSRIINISTSGNSFAVPFVGGYQASKAAQDLLTQAMRRELAFWNIPVVTVKPLLPKTPMWDKAFDQTKQMLSDLPEESRRMYGELFEFAIYAMNRRKQGAITPESSARLIIRAVEARRPKPVYFANFRVRLMTAIMRNLPDRLVDFGCWLVLKTRPKAKIAKEVAAVTTP